VIRVEILDSCPVFRYGLAQILNGAGIHVLATRTMPASRDECPVDVSLVDPDALGIEQTLSYVSDLRKLNNVLVLAHGLPDEEAADLVRAGAAGVISPRAPADVIVDAVRYAADAPAYRCQASDSHLVSTGAAHRATATLSSREEQILQQISRGLTHTQIARRLDISRHTVDTYVKRIRSKLGLGNKAELTRAAVLGDLAGY